ncbi:MAG: hypothetical protein IIC02_13755, partial [Planctomycetes bacterium]|nr:hypothetical protein [Planctomycetota bacterium]
MARWSVGLARIGGLERVQRQAVRWDGLSAPEPLLSSNPDWGTGAFDVTADGSRIGGRIYPDSSTFVAGLWTEETGVMVPLKELLIDQYGLGAAVAGWNLNVVIDITDDGRFMAGSAINPFGIPEAFLVDMGVTLASDLTGNGFVDFEDLTILLANWNRHASPAR